MKRVRDTLGMDEKKRERFVSQWRKYFGDADLPMAIYYSDEAEAEAEQVREAGQCIVELLPAVIMGKPLCFSAESRICGGGRRYLGFAGQPWGSDFAYFLSYGIPGKLKGERYKKSPALVRRSTKYTPLLKAPKPYIVFKRWDMLGPSDNPDVVVFLADLDTIAGLFVLANFDEAEPNAVISPFGSGCSSIVYHPYRELRSRRPRCVMGMFDISARPYIGRNKLSFAVPYPKFDRMVANMNESFLITESWKTLREARVH